MLLTRLFPSINNVRFTIPMVTQLKKVHNDVKKPTLLINSKDETKKKLHSDCQAIRNKYKVYNIYGNDESREMCNVQGLSQRKDESFLFSSEQLLGLNLKHGNKGVYDIEDLTEVLRISNAINTFVCRVPSSSKYVDYMVIVTGQNYRHMLAMANLVRWVYKLKRYTNEDLPNIEGEKSRDWMAMDLGNIALHIFSAKARECYDLESLWSI